jgi:polyferredoxin
MFFVWDKGESLGAFVAGFVRSYAGVALVVAILTTTLALGRHWCSHLCPVGGALELGSRAVPRSLKLDLARVPAVPFRHAYLAVYLLAPALGLGSLCCSYCNFAAVPRALAAPFSMGDLTFFLRFQGLVNLGLLLALGVFTRGGRAYCNLLCPVGALDALANRLGARRGRRMQIDGGACLDCGECSKVCPTWAIEGTPKPTINQLSCMPCRQCQDVCPTGAIHYGRQ